MHMYLPESLRSVAVMMSVPAVRDTWYRGFWNSGSPSRVHVTCGVGLPAAWHRIVTLRPAVTDTSDGFVTMRGFWAAKGVR